MTKHNINRITVVVLDSLGVGELPDAAMYGDVGSNTLANIARAVGGVNLPNMANLGLGNIIDIAGVNKANTPQGCFGKMNEKSPGKDTTTGHWELAGIILDRPFPVFPNGFPEEFISEYQRRIGREVLGNKKASGTEILEELGPEHIKTGKPIVYTSADSVFQVAAHEEVIPIKELYRICEIAREMLTGQLEVARVIARPFVGSPGAFVRTTNRHDYSLPPVRKTVLDTLVENNLDVIGIGKIHDIFAGRGITENIRAKTNQDGVNATIECLSRPNRGLIFTNLVEFDQNYGHRNDPQGYAAALEAFDVRLPEIMAQLKDDDLLILTADHGCDPTTESTDHSREYVPLLVYGPRARAGVNLGIRGSFADLAATVADIFNLPCDEGISFADEVLGG